MFSCSCSCLSFISTNSIRGPQPPGTAAQGSHLSFCPYISRQRPLLGGLHGGLGTFGSLSLSLSCSPNLGLDLSPGLGLELAQLETLGYMGYRGMNLLPKLGMGMLAKSAEFVAAALWDLGLDLLGLDQGLDNLSMCIHGLGIVGLHLQALLVLLGKVNVPLELGLHPP